jgi:hypothetical protein
MKIFISHAAVDKAIAQALVDLIRLGGDVPKNDIFFSSAQGDIPNGEFFVKTILTELENSDLCVALLSGSYMRSKFCLGEIGAAQVRRIAGISDLYTLLVPPATYADLDAVLYGTQSGRILEGHAIDELLDRVTKGAAKPLHAAARSAERDKFLSSAKDFVGAHEARELLHQITTLDLLFDRDERDTIKYKMKLRIVFRNETGRDIVVKRPTWTAKPDELQVRPDWNSSLQVETGGGWKFEQWAGEASEAAIKNNQAFRIWIGLNWAFTDAELRQKHEQLAVGSLHLPVKINGYDVELEKKV